MSIFFYVYFAEMELKCQVQQYEWGKLGRKSLAAEFAAYGRPDDFCVDGTAPYAELWMGTHPNGPSMLKGIGSPSLAEYIDKNPKMLGEESRQKFGDQLPFLFKVLSVNKALSIQVHKYYVNIRRFFTAYTVVDAVLGIGVQLILHNM